MHLRQQLLHLLPPVPQQSWDQHTVGCLLQLCYSGRRQQNGETAEGRRGREREERKEKKKEEKLLVYFWQRQQCLHDLFMHRTLMWKPNQRLVLTALIYLAEKVARQDERERAKSSPMLHVEGKATQKQILSTHTFAAQRQLNKHLIALSSLHV